MKPSNYQFSPYSKIYSDACLALFDANCPEYFASNERTDYKNFLDKSESGYHLCLHADKIIGAFGVINENIGNRRRLNWISSELAKIGCDRGSQGVR